MQSSSPPVRVPQPWAKNAAAPYINTIPNTSQIGIVNGRASWPDGFVPDNFIPVAAGGVPPFGGDFNGLLNQVSFGLQWLQAGGAQPFDATFASNIGGYPKYALIASATTLGLYWLCLVDANTNNPDTGGSGWQAIRLPFAVTVNSNIYVNASTGNDSNDGLTAGTAFATLQHAANYAASINTFGFALTINCTGAFTAGVSNSAITAGSQGPQSVTWNFTSGSTVTCAATSCFFYDNGSSCTINGPVTLVSNGTGTNGCCLIAGNGARIAFGTGTITFGHAGQAHMAAFSGGQIINQGLNYTISGGATYHWSTFSAGQISDTNATITLSGSPGFTAFANAVTQGGMAVFGNVFSGAIGGGTQRYFADTYGLINTNGGGASYLPGTIAGSPTFGTIGTTGGLCV